MLAIDGSKLTLPCTEALEEKYGKAKNQHKEGLVAGHISCLYDIENEMVIDVVLGRYKANERLQAQSHLEYCKSNDLIIFDRGYPSVELISELEKRNIKYLMRVKVKHNLVTESFSNSSLTDTIEKFPNLEENVRIIKVELEKETEILLTNLYEETTYPSEIFKDLYFKRWGVETSYDVIKNVLEIEKFSGYSEEIILQDIYSTIFLKNYHSLLKEELEEEIENRYRKRKHKSKINTSISLGELNRNVLDIFLEKEPEEIINELKNIFLSNVVPIIPNRSERREKDRYRNRKKPKVLKNRKRVI